MNGTIVPFDSDLTEICGVTATDAINIYRYIGRDIEERDERLYLERLRHFVTIMNATGAIMSASYAFMRHDVATVVRLEAVDAFWRIFVIRRGGVPVTTKYPTDPHHLERTPFIEVGDGVALFTIPGSALEAIASHFSSVLLEPTTRSRYLKTRDIFLEREVVRVFAKFFEGTNAQLFPNAHLGDFQHDLLIVDDHTVLIIEAKAGFMKEPFRDIDKAFVRLKQNFDRVIGEAHEQASRTKTRLLHREHLSFVTEDGQTLIDIDGGYVRDIFTVCVTADDFGPLARDMSSLLDKSDDEVFPWAVMLNDLETFLGAFEHLKRPPTDLYEFLRDRTTLHGRVESGDELEIAGYFLKHGTLRPLDRGPATRTQIDSRYSDVFDEIFFQTDAEL